MIKKSIHYPIQYGKYNKYNAKKTEFMGLPIIPFETIETKFTSVKDLEKVGINLELFQKNATDVVTTIEDILPDIVNTEDTGCKTVNPDNLTWYLVNAVKELSTQVDELKAEITTLKGE